MRRSFYVFVLATLILLIPSFRSIAQTKKGDFKISLGAFSSYGYPDGLPSTATNSIPTTNLTGEYLLSKSFSIGPYISHTYVYTKFPGMTTSYKDDWRGWDLGLRGTYYLSSLFGMNEKFDLYVAGFLGYTTGSLRYDRSNIYRDELNYTADDISGGGIAGLRCYISPWIGLYGELGMSRQFFAGAGVSFSLKKKD